MTPAEKKARRNFRHQAQNSVTPNFMRGMGMRSTTGNIHAAVKLYVDRQLADIRKVQRSATVHPIPNAQP